MVISHLNHVFAALADPTRRRIIERLGGGDRSVNELVRGFRMSQPAVTKHLNVLERAGLISRRRRGRQRICRLQPKALDASLTWIQNCRHFWNERLDALEEYITDPRQTREP